LEYFRWKYETPRQISIFLFLIRITPFILCVIIKSPDLYAFVFAPFVIYYATFIFENRIRWAVFIIILVTSALVPYFAQFPFPDNMTPPEFIMTTINIFRVGKVIFFQTMAILWFEDRKNIKENQKLLEDLKKSNMKIREYASIIADTVALEERNRLARDIHDSIGHYLTATNIQLAKAQAYFKIDPESALKAIEDARTASTEAMEDVRESVRSLKAQKDFSLSTVIKELIGRIEGKNFDIKFQLEGDDSRCSYAVRLAIYRVIQEALTNAVKHSLCSKINISVSFADNMVYLSVKDDGKGFIIGNISESSSGLSGLKERIELVRGSFHIRTSPDEGTLITVEAPFDPVKTEYRTLKNGE
jgi:signal transduction histidine kinase